MFASDYDKKGTSISFTVSVILHACILLLLFFYQHKQRSKLMDYTLTEITMLEEVPEEQKPMKIEKPKSVFDILKQVIPIKQKPSLELARPDKIKLNKPKKIELQKPKALKLTKMDSKLKPSMKKIDLDNEIGTKKLSPAMVKRQLELRKREKLMASAPSKISLSKATKKSSFLPVQRSAIKIGATSKKKVLPVSSKISIDKLKTKPKKKIETENIVIKKRKALLIQGEIAGREILVAKKPKYPRWAQERGIEASVTIYFVVRPDGTVTVSYTHLTLPTN